MEERISIEPAILRTKRCSEGVENNFDERFASHNNATLWLHPGAAGNGQPLLTIVVQGSRS
jgi:hypothetical protein